MFSFRQLLESMQDHTDSIESEATNAIRTGLNIREDFWDDFISLCNNTNAVATLLGVRPEQVGSWGSKIREKLDNVKISDVPDNKTKVIDTGNL